MTALLILVSHAVVALGFYQMGRTDELLDIIRDESEAV